MLKTANRLLNMMGDSNRSYSSYEWDDWYDMYEEPVKPEDPWEKWMEYELLPTKIGGRREVITQLNECYHRDLKYRRTERRKRNKRWRQARRNTARWKQERLAEVEQQKHQDLLDMIRPVSHITWGELMSYNY